MGWPEAHFWPKSWCVISLPPPSQFTPLLSSLPSSHPKSLTEFIAWENRQDVTWVGGAETRYLLGLGLRKPVFLRDINKCVRGTQPSGGEVRWEGLGRAESPQGLCLGCDVIFKMEQTRLGGTCRVFWGLSSELGARGTPVGRGRVSAEGHTRLCHDPRAS